MSFKINNTSIGKDLPVYFIAEIGSNFDGNLAKAKELIWLAKDSGANAVKFQHYTAESLVSDNGFSKLAGNMTHQKDWKGTVFEVYDKASLDHNWTRELKQECDKACIDFITSPYSEFLIDYVDEFLPAYKVGSGDITYHKLIKKMATKRKPLLIATGASDFSEVRMAYDLVKGDDIPIVLLQCNTNYTANKSNYKFLNINVLKTFSECFPKAYIGISDHMPGYTEVLGAVALGACIVEKHFTDNVLNNGPDHKFALDPDSFFRMVNEVRDLENALGDGIKRVEENELHTAVVQRRGLYVVRDLEKGSILSSEDLVALRPFLAGMFPPFMEKNLIGSILNRSLSAGDPIKTTDVL